MKQLYVLVGVPASGKSTWIKNQDWALGLNIVSTDVWVEDYANRMGKTYSDVFDEYMPTAVKLMADHAVKCRENNHDIIWDQTSTTVLSRAKKIRMASRAGKVVPMEIVESMIANWEEPTKEEGFDEIWYN